jgi:erythromycin esterase-like protein
MRLSNLLAAALIWPAAAQETSPVQDWIASHAIRLTTPEAGHGFSDMQPLKAAIGNARIASLGEATHGTREFFQLKHRMLEFLATEMGFTIFSIEANMPEAYRLNDYVLNGKGDPAKLLKGMYFWTWDTEEVLDMIGWMREFNKSGKGRVEFTGFDMQTTTVAAQIVGDFVTKTDPEYSDAVKSANEMTAKAQPARGGGNFGVATATFPVSAAAGKKVRFSGYIKTANVAGGYAGLWWRVDGSSGILAFDNMQNRGATGTTDWKEYSLELPVAADARNINFGALFPGSGSAWFDDFKVELDGKPYEDPSLFDFGFESPQPRGFFTGGNGYHIAIDTEVFHSGKQSLMMNRVTAIAAPSATVDPKAAATAWKDVVAHLEASRDAYRKKDATDREIDWAIQNARIVVQCMQMRGGQVTRDQSMAENVKWIADHSPGAKIVLWAHNGHVQAGGADYPSMGAALRKVFGSQMVVFGFAFNRGSFQSMSQSGKGLKEFTVPAAQAGSLDSMLAAPGIPLFALDLRQVPQSGPVADWWKQPHMTRSIGAVYPEDSPYAFQVNMNAPDAFDVLLFVANTTAARKNPPVAK